MWTGTDRLGDHDDPLMKIQCLRQICQNQSSLPGVSPGSVYIETHLYTIYVHIHYTVQPVFKNQLIACENVVSQDRWSQV